MKKSIVILSVLIHSISFGQQYGNEWINYSQQYFHLPVYKTGIHRIDYSTIENALLQSGINVSSISSDQFQIFGREEEVPLYVFDNNDGFLNPGDFIDFYAERNDGWLDSLVYDSAHFILDPYYSLFNDTIRYYLTWDGSGNGKRMQIETDVNYVSYTSVTNCWKKSFIKYNHRYVLGEQLNGISSPNYTEGEGWVGSRLAKENANSYNLSTSNVYNVGPDAICSISIVSSNSSSSNTNGNNHNTEVLYGSTTVLDSSYYGYQLIKHDFNIPINSIGNPTTLITHNIANIGQGTDYQNLSAITIWYPHTFNINGDSTFSLGLPFNTSIAKSRITFNNINPSVTNPILYVINEDIKRIPVVANGSDWECLIPNQQTGDSSICYIVDSLNFHSVFNLTPVNKTSYFNDFATYNLNNAFLIITHNKLLLSARNYAAYRSTQYDTLVLDIEELYHQFSGGIYKNPLAIKRFINLSMNEWPSWPSHLFLLGKSIRANPEYTAGYRKDTLHYKNCLVPSWGYPTSDNHLTLGIDASSRGFAIPTGRRSVTHSAQLDSYLNKVQEHESNQDPMSFYDIPNKEWQKNVLYFGGSSDSAEQAYINTWLNYYIDIIEDTLFGGYTYLFEKDPFSSSLNNNDFQKTQELLESGISLMTFFGHSSSGTGFSQNIDSPDNWNNQGKYPIVIGLGCYTGDVHGTDTTGYTEALMSPSDEGAIGFISTVKQGFQPHINNYTLFLHLMMGQFGYGKTIGEQMKMTVDTIDLNTIGIPWNPIYQSNYNGMSLQGDPAIRLNWHQKPEIVLDESRVWYEPSVIDLSIDTFSLFVVVNNIGKTFDDSVRLEITRHFPMGQDSLIYKTITGVYFRDTVEFRIPVQANISVGINTFDIVVDLPLSIIDEQQDEINNNQITKTIIILSNALFPIWPYEYAIIGNQIDTLKASTMNPLEPLKQYIFEIDTTDEFNSSFKKYQYIISAGGVVEALPNNWINSLNNNPDPLIFTDSSVYFWRCSPDSSTLDWQERSFQYIDKKWGWGQSHFFQFKENEFTSINYDKPNRSFDFLPSVRNISCNNYIQHIGMSSEWTATFWEIDGITSEYGGYLYPSIMVGVIDPNTLDYWRTPFADNSTSPATLLNPNNCFGQFNGDPAICSATSLMGRNREHGYFVFNYKHSHNLDSLVSLLDNTIPIGHYIIAYSYIPNIYGSMILYNAPLYAAWPNELFTSFQTLGASGFINQSQPDDGFIFFCKKGDPNSAQEIHSNPIQPNTPSAGSQYLQLNATVTGSSDNGTIKSTIIGPSKKWNTIYFKQHPKELNSDDSSRFIVYGVLHNFSEIKLIDTLFDLNDSIINLNSLINAIDYPMLRFEMQTQDLTDLTPAHNERWQIIYEPVPELALNPKKGYYLNVPSEGIEQGDSIKIAVAIENISKFNMDSLLVNYTLYDNNHSAHQITYPRQDSLRIGQVLLDTLSYPTNSISETCNLWVTANPKINGIAQDQIEHYYFNNILQTSLIVNVDITNPILDVTFDGVHILDKDIISPNPHIVITLDDENKFLLLNEDTDTSNFQLFINLPNSSSWDKIYFFNGLGESILKYYPAENEVNKFIIEYDPIFSIDGIYKLKVQGRDKSNNFSGDNDYQISFEVINRSSITNFYNYPNPFSTRTHFVFTLTGSVFPEQLLIQIMNISGRVVREIGLDELGGLKIGHNKTDFYWDGKDHYGDQLANGIYLYRVLAKINGVDIEHRVTSGDHAFTKRIGKMYLIK